MQKSKVKREISTKYWITGAILCSAWDPIKVISTSLSMYADTSRLGHLAEELSHAHGFQAAVPSTHQGCSCSYETFSSLPLPPDKAQYRGESDALSLCPNATQLFPMNCWHPVARAQEETGSPGCHSPVCVDTARPRPPVELLSHGHSYPCYHLPNKLSCCWLYKTAKPAPHCP